MVETMEVTETTPVVRLRRALARRCVRDTTLTDPPAGARAAANGNLPMARTCARDMTLTKTHVIAKVVAYGITESVSAMLDLTCATRQSQNWEARARVMLATTSVPPTMTRS